MAFVSARKSWIGPKLAYGKGAEWESTCTGRGIAGAGERAAAAGPPITGGRRSRRKRLQSSPMQRRPPRRPTELRPALKSGARVLRQKRRVHRGRLPGRHPIMPCRRRMTARRRLTRPMANTATLQMLPSRMDRGRTAAGRRSMMAPSAERRRSASRRRRATAVQSPPAEGTAARVPAGAAARCQAALLQSGVRGAGRRRVGRCRAPLCGGKGGS